MPYGVGSLLYFGLLLYCLIDVIRTDDVAVRGLPKLTWVVVIVFLPLIGSIAWLVAGRPEGAGLAPGSYSGARPAGYRYSTRGNPVRERRPQAPNPPRRSIAPDDDPEFLRRLEERMRRPEDPADGDR